MEIQNDVATKGKQRASPQATPVQQDFLFVDASKSAKSSRQGRRNARSFVMQKARRERPWSTSKHAKKRNSPESSSPATVGTPDLSPTPITSTPSPTRSSTGSDYFGAAEVSNHAVVKQEVCSDCQIFLCRPGQSMCPRCIQLQPRARSEDIDNGLFDPFGTFPVVMDGRTSELLEHCK
jgi:hypothetical protein